MALINFTNLDFDQIKVSIRDYLRSNSNFTDYDFEGSNLSTIIDLLAYNTYVSSYNANMISNEVFIDSATLRENVVSLAKNIGYVPRSRTSARAIVSFFVDVSSFSTNPVTLTLKKGIVCSSSSSFASQNFIFSIPSDITVPIVNGLASFDNIEIYEGSLIADFFTVDAFDKSRPQKYILNNANIDTSTIRVTVRDSQNSTQSRRFILSEDLFSIGSDSPIFFIQEIEDQRYELIFGDGVFGKKLENSNYIESSYIVTNGQNGNGVSSFTFIGKLVDNNGIPVSNGVSLVSTTTSSRGGKEIESIESIKTYAPRIYAAQNRAVTALDYSAIIPKIYPEAESISVYGGEDLDPPQFGRVFISIKPENGRFLSSGVKNNIKNKLREYSVAGIVPEILDLKYLFVEVDTSVYYNPNLAANVDSLRTLVFDNIKSYSNSTELNRYGARFKYSKYQKIIDDTNESITSNITKVQMRRDLSVILNGLVEYEICYGNEFYIQKKDGYNIKSSGFSVSYINDVVYLADLPNPDNITGTLFLFSNPSSPTIRKNKVGTIDYMKGEIRIDPINIVSTEKKIGDSPIIEISAVPKSNDVLGKQDLYLQLDINKTKLNMISDDTLSNSSTNYTVTSSYINGDFVRK